MTESGTEIAADFAVRRPAGHESLNVVVQSSAPLLAEHSTYKRGSLGR